jgi:hypothetical protein
VILVISHPADPHATAVIDRLRAGGQEVVLIDLSELPAHATVSIDYCNGAQPHLEYRPDAKSLDLSRASAVWWRRPQAPDLSGIGDAAAGQFAHGEWREVTAGLWQLLDHARWMNDPVKDEFASRKAYQLRVARECGLSTPRTLMTSDPERARAFISEVGMGRTIFKTFSCTYQVWRETRLLRADDLAEIESVRLAPVIFQEYVPPGVDLRVTVVGDRVFPMAIDASGTDYPVDFRMSLGQAGCSAVVLPDEVQDGLRRFMDRLGLVYGAVDFRRTPDGDHMFFEVNTAGEFLFVEERTGQPITQAVADWLTGV